MGLRKIVNIFEIVPVNKIASFFVIIIVSTSLIDKVKTLSKFMKVFKFFEIYSCILLLFQIYVAEYIIYISDQHFMTLKDDTKQVMIDLFAFIFINDMDVILGDFYVKFFVRPTKDGKIKSLKEGNICALSSQFLKIKLLYFGLQYFLFLGSIWKYFL